jgi:uncharacterized DUF497 family protein
MLEIEFDPRKDASNLDKHGIRLARAREFTPVKILEDDRKNYGEIRYRGFGFILAFTVTELKTGGKRVRAISLRPANEKEIEQYGLTKKGR